MRAQRIVRTAALLLSGSVLISVQACREDPSSLPSGNVRLAIRAALASVSTRPSTARPIDRVAVRVSALDGEVLASRDTAVNALQQSVALDVDLVLDAARQEVIVLIELLAGSDVQYQGEGRMMVDATREVNATPVIELEAVAPVLLVSPTALRLEGVADSTDVTGTFTVSNRGGRPLTWTAVSDVPWLAIEPSSGTTGPDRSDVITVGMAVSGLSAGEHPATIQVQAIGAIDSPDTITVTASIEARATLHVAPSGLQFSAVVGTNPAAETLRIQNTGAAPMIWSAREEGSWLAISPSAGTLAPGESVGATVAVSTDGLSAGRYSGMIAIDAPGARNAPQGVGVELDVHAVPTYDLTVLGAGDGDGVVTSNDGMIDCTITAGIPGGQCRASYEQGTVSLTATPAGTATFDGWRGDCRGNACLVRMSEVRTVTATFSRKPAEITLEPASLAFSGQQGGPDPGPQTFRIRNTGGSPLNWQAVEDVSWLSLSPSSGTLEAGGTGTVAVDVDIAGVGANTYSTRIEVSAATGASNSPQHLGVTLRVAPELVPLTIRKSGDGSGTVTSSPPGITCRLLAGDDTDPTGDCTELFAVGTEVRLAAEPDAGMRVAGWGSTCSGTSSTCTFSIARATSVTVRMEAIPPDPIAVSISPATITMEVGQTARLVATVTGGTQATPRTVSWSSSSAQVATIDANGVVTAVAEGSATIAATATADPSARAQARVTVVGARAAAPVLSALQDPQLVTLNDTTRCSNNRGSLFRYRMSYRDEDGDINRNAQLRVSWQRSSGDSGQFTHNSPTFSGDGFSGEVVALICQRFDNASAIRTTFTLVDASGNASNAVSNVTQRPDGANGAGLPAANASAAVEAVAR